MKIAIVYKSLTGNTKLVAEAIKEELVEQNIVYFGEPVAETDADFYFIGSWTDKGLCAKEIIEFVGKLKNKKIAYFGTAGFGGSPEYYKSLAEHVHNLVDKSNEFLAPFFCQGKMPMSVRNRYVQLIQEHPDDRELQVNIENFDKALFHPDEQDIQEAGKWAASLLSRL